MKTIIMLLVALISYVPTASAQQENPAFSQAELDQMLAPIALYPDVLLSQILVAATYPLEVVEAARWSAANPGLEGEQAANAAEHQAWDPSVKALVAFPGVLNRMYDDLNWTRALGDAFLFQEAQVMDSVQNLRQRAYEAGNLNSTENARVVRENQVIVIEPANPQVVYVPYYNPQVVYGSWWWPGYAPVYWGPPPGIHLNLGFNWGWGRGIFVSPGFFFSSFDWYRRQTVVVHRRHNYYQRPHFVSGRHIRYADYPRWRHNSNHRRGVAYRHDSLQRQFGTSRRSGSGYADTPQNKFDRTDTINRPQFGRRSHGWSSYAATRNHDSRATAQSTGRRNNRSDTDRISTRERWRQSSNISPNSLASESSSRNSGSSAQSASSGNTRRQNSSYSRDNVRRRESSSRRTTSDISSNRETGNFPTQRRSSVPNREANRNQDPRRQMSSGTTLPNRRASSFGPSSPAVSPERQRTRTPGNGRVTRSESRRQSPSFSTTVNRDTGGASTGARYRSSNSNNSRGDSGNYSSGRSSRRRESSN
ncbi:MAG: hypothetical protein CVV06_05855 [Gammaproteobacteria bacterium HGW-Gammaproteobacteria-10]|nr:MAG: hypothetical protein CVV06_05855 [Gammaproteobacteria bacterium HGW-Gammaproteobacteria-10]